MPWTEFSSGTTTTIFLSLSLHLIKLYKNFISVFRSVRRTSKRVNIWTRDWKKKYCVWFVRFYCGLNKRKKVPKTKSYTHTVSINYFVVVVFVHFLFILYLEIDQKRYNKSRNSILKRHGKSMRQRCWKIMEENCFVMSKKLIETEKKYHSLREFLSFRIV